MSVAGTGVVDAWPSIEDESGPDRASSTSSRNRRVLGAVLLVAAVSLPLLRQTGVRSWETLWAEDGTVYFEQARREGGLAVLLRGYAGYLQLPPRILGALSLLVPVRSLTLYFAVAASVVNAALAWFTYWASAGWVKPRPVRLALASLVILMPALGVENTATGTNTIWTFAMVAPWALVSLRERTRAVILRSIVVFLSATATVISAFFIPLALGQLWFRRSRASWTVAGAYFVGLVVQGAVILSTVDEATALPPTREPAKLVELIGTRLFAEYLIGDRTIAALWSDHATLIAVVPLLAVIALSGVLAWRVRQRPRVLLAGTLLLLAVVVYALTVWSRGTNAVVLTEADVRAIFPSSTPPTGDPARAYVSAQLRYSVVPVLLLASAVAVLVSGVAAAGRRRAARIVQGLFVAHAAVLMVVNFSVTTGRSSAPVWSESVDGAFANACQGSASGVSVEVQTSQRGSFPVELTCRELAP